MPVDWLTVSAAFLTGLLGGVHCVAMCGGIAAGVALGSGGKAPLRTAVESNLGRLLGYAVAGALVAGIGAGALRLAQAESLMFAMRMGVGLVLVLAALRLFDRRGRLAFLSRPGAALWTRLAPLQRRLLPADTTPRRIALGLLWGWLPCGLSTTLLFAAWLTADALQGGLVMAAFGLGTLPVMIPLTWSGARAARWLARPGARVLAGTLVLMAGLATLAAPWLAQVPALHAWLEALGCRTLPG